MTHNDLERGIQAVGRKERRRKRRERIAKLLGLVASAMFGTGWIGIPIAIGIIVLVLVIIMRLL